MSVRSILHPFFNMKLLSFRSRYIPPHILPFTEDISSAKQAEVDSVTILDASLKHSVSLLPPLLFTVKKCVYVCVGLYTHILSPFSSSHYLRCPERRVFIASLFCDFHEIFKAIRSPLLQSSFFLLGLHASHLFSCDSFEFNLLTSLNLTWMKWICMSAIRANRCCFEHHEALFAGSDVEIAVPVRGRSSLQRFAERPLSPVIWQANPSIISDKVDDFCRFTGQIPHTAHHLLNA